MLTAAVLQPGTALACLPQKFRQPVSQLPSLHQWTQGLTQTQNLRTSTRKQTACAQPVLEERGASPDTSQQTSPRVPSILESIQSRQVARLRPQLVDKQGRVMLKNFTKAEIVQWLVEQGM